MFWNPNLHQLVGERRESWGDSNSKTIALMRQFIADVVGRYKNSPAIWAWELGNEWNLSADLPNAASFRGPGEDERDDFKSPQMINATTEFARAVRKIDSHRPIITGHSVPRAAAWHNTAEGTWTPDTFEQWKEIVLRNNTKHFDNICVHIYADSDPIKEGGKWNTTWRNYLQELKKWGNEHQLPIFVGEFGNQVPANRDKTLSEEVKKRFTKIVSDLEAAQIDIAAVWVFDLGNQDETWNITFENDRAYMLQEVIAANKRFGDSVKIKTK